MVAEPDDGVEVVSVLARQGRDLPGSIGGVIEATLEHRDGTEDVPAVAGIGASFRFRDGPFPESPRPRQVAPPPCPVGGRREHAATVWADVRRRIVGELVGPREHLGMHAPVPEPQEGGGELGRDFQIPRSQGPRMGSSKVAELGLHDCHPLGLSRPA